MAEHETVTKADVDSKIATHAALLNVHSIPRAATLVVAANNSSAKSKAQADYVCDGVNDHVEIQAALDALPATGGEVRLLDGTYYIEVSLVLDSYQTLRGCGRNTILTTTTADLDIITATGEDGGELVGILIADLCVDGNALTGDIGILWTYVDHSEIANTWIRDNGEQGIYFSYCDFNRIADNSIQANYRYGIQLSHSDNNTVAGNSCVGNRGNGIDIYFSNNNTIVGNTSQGSTSASSGIKVACSYLNTVTGNTCQGNAYHGIYICGESEDNTIAGNTCQGGAYEGIYVSSSNKNTVTGNICQENGDCGIYITDSDYNTISGNVCQGNSLQGIVLDDSSNNTIVGNLCLENSQDATNTYDDIFIDGDSDSNNVQGNTCRAGALANVPRYGININNAGCNDNLVTNNDIHDDGFGTGALNDIGVGTITVAGNRT